MTKSKRVGVLMGGPSCERDISMKSGMAVYHALKNKEVNAVPVELEKSQTMNGYAERARQEIRSSRLDVAFIALHGEFGEDGSIQALLEEMGIPYTGSKAHASRLGMDKIVSKDIFKSSKIRVPRSIVLNKADLDKASDSHVYFRELGSPLVIKPSDEGSSIGLSIIDKEGDFSKAAIDNAFKYSDSVIIEEYVRGREITVGILEDHALPIVEIVPKKRFFDFEAKYEKGLTDYRVPAEIERETYLACQKTGLLAHNALGARFFSRVDMILSEDKIPVVLEVNTIPGLTETSLLPKAAQAAGVDFGELVLKILGSSLW